MTFEDGSDVIGMVGLNYFDLNVSQGTDSYSSHTILSISGEYVAILENTTAANINIPDFMPMPDDYVGDSSDTYEISSDIGNTTDTNTSNDTLATFTASIDKWLPDTEGSESKGWMDHLQNYTARMNHNQIQFPTWCNSCYRYE